MVDLRACSWAFQVNVGLGKATEERGGEWGDVIIQHTT